MVCPAKVVHLQSNAAMAEGIHTELPICMCKFKLFLIIFSAHAAGSQALSFLI